MESPLIEYLKYVKEQLGFKPLSYMDSIIAQQISEWVMPDWLPDNLKDLPQKWYTDHLTTNEKRIN